EVDEMGDGGVDAAGGVEVDARDPVVVAGSGDPDERQPACGEHPGQLPGRSPADDDGTGDRGPAVPGAEARLGHDRLARGRGRAGPSSWRAVEIRMSGSPRAASIPASSPAAPPPTTTAPATVGPPCSAPRSVSARIALRSAMGSMWTTAMRRPNIRFVRISASREYGPTWPADTAGLISAIIGDPPPSSGVGGCPDRPGPVLWPAAPRMARACCTFARDAAETDSGSRSAREAVAFDTPAVPAISASRTCRCSG